MAIRVGDVGRAITTLGPSGKIEIDGVKLDARSDGSVIEAGSMVIVLRGDLTGYIVGKHSPGTRPLPNHGEVIRKADAQQSAAEVAAVAHNEERARRAELRARMHRGVMWAMGLGAVAGAASAALGLRYHWASESVGALTLTGGSIVAGAGWALVLYFFTGVFVVRVLPSEEDAVFEPDFIALVVGLVGAALGFWVTFASGDAITIAAQSMGISLAFAALSAAALRLLF